MTPPRRRPELPVSLPPRGLQRELAARYIGVSATKFDDMVEDGRMPRARRVDGRYIWDRLQLDSAFDRLPVDGGDPAAESTPAIVENDWDDVLPPEARRQ